MNHTYSTPLKLIAVMIAATAFTTACSTTANKMSAEPAPVMSQPVTTTQPDSTPVASAPDDSTLSSADTSATDSQATDNNTTASSDTKTTDTVATSDNDNTLPDSNADDTYNQDMLNQDADAGTSSATPTVTSSSDTGTTLQTPIATEDTTNRPASTTFNFGFNKTKLDADSQKQVEEHGQYLAAHPNMKVIINGYSDKQGNSKYNDALSLKRADYVKDLLLSQGVQKDQVEVYGWGASSPLPGQHSNRDNRRVELKYSDGYVAQTSIKPAQ